MLEPCTADEISEGHVGYHKRYYREARALEARRQAFTVTVEPLEMVEPELDEVA